MLRLLPVLIFSAAALQCLADVTRSDVIDGDKEEFETELSISDFAAAAADQSEIDLKTIGIDVKADPIEGSKSEGDIAIANIKQFVDDSNKRGRNAIRQVWRRWPGGVIPYTISSRYGSYSRRVIAKAIDAYHQHTCIKLVAREVTKHRDYIYLHPDDGCYSLVGRTGGRQPLSLDAGCIQTGTIVHELMHAVGFFHEQSRADRDANIEIVWGNVMLGADDQFEKYSLRVIDHMDEPYDYNSVMHYGPYAFSGNGRKTILAKKSGATKMGQRIGFSETDLRKINKLYYCPQVDEDKEDNDKATESPKPFRPLRPGNGDDDDEEECKDTNWRCTFWSMGVFGYCEKYREIRDVVCPEACGTCGSQNSRRRPTTTTTTTTTTTRRPIIRGIQSNKGSTCKDFNPACVTWAIKGHCIRNGFETFMGRQCPVSCGKCPKGTIRVRPTDDNCVDSSSHTVRCEVTKLFDRCHSSHVRQMVQSHCRKSCGLCD